ncbi:protein kinase [Streptomonospora sp. NEAU-YY374]|nr:protein kinase [Streptomonospora nanhaiensis]MBV2366354.1 protein kinase [Streptomonospora nanhaiensis]MBX9391743.1 protein kinase [Streptomonospora nanhaiensis]
MTIQFAGLIQPYTGHISSIKPVSEGSRWTTTALIDCEKGEFFVKAVPNRPGGLRDSVLREWVVNPFVRPVSPAVQWQAEDGDWVVLGFDRIDGRSADFSPGSSDLPKIIDVLNRISRIPIPEVAGDWEETRWDAFLPEKEIALVRGSDLLYVDVQPDNIMIGSGQTWAVDWEWPTKGAGFISPACFVVQLISGGHSPAAAETWVGNCIAWESADPAAIDAFARANARLQQHLAERFPEESWLAEMATAAEVWADHRLAG